VLSLKISDHSYYWVFSWTNIHSSVFLSVCLGYDSGYLQLKSILKV
jgi:hypothetical protein